VFIFLEFNEILKDLLYEESEFQLNKGFVNNKLIHSVTDHKTIISTFTATRTPI